jgi:hypothetical protein
LIVAIVAATLVLTGCGLSGVTRAPSVAKIENDLGRTVRVRLCSSDGCSSGFYPPNEKLDPGGSWPVNVSSAGVPNVYLVESPDETARYGCLPLVSPKLRRTTIVVRASERVPCRTEVDEHAFWPKRWRDVP